MVEAQSVDLADALVVVPPVASAVEAQHLPTPSGSKVPSLGRLEWGYPEAPG